MTTTAVAMQSSRYESAALGRYKNGYAVAKAISRVGRAVKILGSMLIVGGIYVACMAGGNNPIPLGLGIVGAILGLLTYVAGVLLGAQGELMTAAFDTAVNSSQFLTTDAMASAMGMEATTPKEC